MEISGKGVTSRKIALPAFGELLAKGSEKKCYRHADNRGQCIKFASKNKCKQMKRELAYFTSYFAKTDASASCVPQFYGWFERDDGIGYVQELFLSKEKGGIFDEAVTLADHIEKIRNHPQDSAEVVLLRRMLAELKEQFINHGIVVSDLHVWNILLVRKGDHQSLKVIDGFGITEAVPFSYYIPFLRRMKIERQWDKFVKRTAKIMSFVI